MTTLLLTTWNGRLSPVLDVARQAELVKADAGRIVSRATVTLPGSDLDDQASALLTLQPQVLVCGAVSRPLAGQLTAAGIQLIPFRAGGVEEVIESWLQGRLTDEALLMPGCCGRRLGWCGGRGQGRGHCRSRGAGSRGPVIP
ncbi:MAG: hypothetical protein GX571_09735 [Lentisphaerae bacterium]|jgi:predicted Fe-Mo cluster-binding NifX family protein|nr:hypothetical protein [Lentisphaerota bacterium]